MREFWAHLVQIWGFFEPFLLACEILFCLRCFRLRKRWLPLFVLLCIVYVSVPGTPFDPKDLWIFSIGSLNFGFFFMWLVSMAIIWVGFEIHWNEALFAGIVAHILQHIWCSVMRLLEQYIGWDYEGLASNTVRFFLADALLLAALLYLPVYFQKYRGSLAANRSLLAFSFFAQLIINFLFNYMMSNEFSNPASYLYDIAASILLLLILYGVFSRDQLRSEAKTLERLIAESEAKHRAAMENAESLDRKCHDLKHQIAALRVAPEGQREEYIRELEETVETFERLYKTGNDTLDVLLAEKQPICAKDSISLTVLADASALGNVRPLDLYALFGNALDNAIEAARQVPQPDGRVICLNITRRGSMTSVDLENSCARAASFRDGLPMTTKGDTERHGYGVKSIRYLVEKYGGVMELSQEEGRFSLNILLPGLDVPAA